MGKITRFTATMVALSAQREEGKKKEENDRRRGTVRACPRISSACEKPRGGVRTLFSKFAIDARQLLPARGVELRGPSDAVRVGGVALAAGCGGPSPRLALLEATVEVHQRHDHQHHTADADKRTRQVKGQIVRARDVVQPA